MEDWFNELPNLRLEALQLAFLGFRPLNLFENDGLQRGNLFILQGKWPMRLRLSDEGWNLAMATPQSKLSHCSCPWGRHLVKIELQDIRIDS